MTHPPLWSELASTGTAALVMALAQGAIAPRALRRSARLLFRFGRWVAILSVANIGAHVLHLVLDR